MKEIIIYSLNDFHGMIFPNESCCGISKIGEFIINQKKNNDYVIVLSAGDMFQGGSVSTLTKGEALVEAMNIIGFDAMTIGNHEFDWDIETVLKYNDYNKDNGELNCKFIISNIIYKDSKEKPEWALPYITFIKDGLKFGVIGIIGEEQEKDILKMYVSKYEFTNEFESIKKYSKVLHCEEKCDIVILCAHTDTTNVNLDITNFCDDEKVDVIINGHTHQAYYGEYTNNDKCVPYVQSGSYGKYLGYIKLEYDEINKRVVNCEVSNINTKTFNKNNTMIDDALKKYQDYIDLSNTRYGTLNCNLEKNIVLDMITEKLKKEYHKDISIINTGGIRSVAFPLNEGDVITYEDLFKMMPFENYIVTCKVSGKDLKNVLNLNGLCFSNINFDIVNDKVYDVVTIDFALLANEAIFGDYKDYCNTNILIRDFIIKIIKNNCLN